MKGKQEQRHTKKINWDYGIHKEYKYTKNTSTQRIQTHKEYKHTKNTSTQRIQAHKEYKHTKNTDTQKKNTGKMKRYAIHKKGTQEKC